jgi:segregation and condensation protein A
VESFASFVSATTENRGIDELGILVHDVERGKIEPTEFQLKDLILTWISAFEEDGWSDLDVVSVFVQLATRLLQLKLRMMLPIEEDDEDVEDMLQLDPAEIEMIQIMSRRLAEMEENESRFTFCAISREDETNETVWEGSHSLAALIAAAGELLLAMESREPLLLPGAPMSPKEARSHVIAYIAGHQRSLMKVLNSAESRLELVSYFLAVLELVRSGLCQMSIRRGRVSLRLVNYDDMVTEKP